MDIDSDHIVALIQGQARIEQAVMDVKENMTKGMTFLHTQHQNFVDGEHKDLSKRVGKVERKVWYGTGAAAALGFIAGFFKH